MRSISFPNMFTSSSTNVTSSSSQATKQNLDLLLHSEKGELFGDPYYGIRLKKYLFDQNSYILKDILIDEIYTQLALFIPQLVVSRNDISIIQDKEKGKLYCTFKAVNQLGYTVDTYSLVIYNEQD